MNSILFRCMYLAVFIFIAGCSDSVQHLVKTSANPQPENAVFNLLKDSTLFTPHNFYSYCALYDFYNSRNHKLVWLKDDRLNQQGDSLLNILRRVKYYGLIPEDYHPEIIDSLTLLVSSEKSGLSAIALLDITMTDAFMKMAYHVRYGRVQKNELTKTLPSTDADAALLRMLRQSIRKNNLSEALKSWEPFYASYKILKRELGRKLDSLSLSIDNVAHLKFEEQISDLAINMEQWRWEPDSISTRFIMVNIPSFKLDVIDRDSSVFESNVVVGALHSQTPTLDASIKNFVLYPTWNVPRSIATLELLPKIKRDSSYLFSNNYRVLDMQGNVVPAELIDWENYNRNNFPFMLQQAEGGHNALGLVKFTFQNDYNVYLHDTNAKRFFKSAKRAYSHGCVRVEKALELARFLVNEDNPYCSPGDVDRYLQSAKSKLVVVKPVELRIRYYTCEARSDGTVYFHDDIYGRNNYLKQAIYCRK